MLGVRNFCAQPLRTTVRILQQVWLRRLRLVCLTKGDEVTWRDIVLLAYCVAFWGGVEDAQFLGNNSTHFIVMINNKERQ